MTSGQIRTFAKVINKRFDENFRSRRMIVSFTELPNLWNVNPDVLLNNASMVKVFDDFQSLLGSPHIVIEI